ncbi:hypothetical protein ACJX0J_010705, partial [Zea mays]
CNKKKHDTRSRNFITLLLNYGHAALLRPWAKLFAVTKKIWCPLLFQILRRPWAKLFEVTKKIRPFFRHEEWDPLLYLRSLNYNIFSVTRTFMQQQCTNWDSSQKRALVTPLSIFWLEVVTTDHLAFDSDCRQFSWHEANLFPVTLLSVFRFFHVTLNHMYYLRIKTEDRDLIFKRMEVRRTLNARLQNCCFCEYSPAKCIFLLSISLSIWTILLTTVSMLLFSTGL